MKGSLEQLKQALVPIAPYREQGGQLKFNCPRCENELGMDIDKFNLEISYTKNAYKCWACGQHGNLEMLVRKYGYREFVELFKNKEYKNQFGEEEEKSEILELPKHCMNVLNNPVAAKYLLERGLSKDKVRERNIKFCYADEYKNCIIFPSYDKTGRLNGFVSHNLETKKYKKRKAKDFTCFYESFIDKRSLIIVTEGAYDSLVVPNAIPMLGIGLDDAMLDFLSGTRVLLIVDNDVSKSVINGLIEQLQTVCLEVIHHTLDQEYQDLNHYWVNDSIDLIEELQEYY